MHRTTGTHFGPRRDTPFGGAARRQILDQRPSTPLGIAAAIRSVFGPTAAQAWLAFRRRGDYDAIGTDGEHLGIPLALLLRFSRSAVRHVTIGHRLSARKKRLFFSLLGVHRRIDRVALHSRHQYDLSVRTLGIEPYRLSLIPYQVDTTFWTPQKTPAERLVVSAGLEHRDYPTLFRAVEGLDAQVVIGAASHWSRHAFADVARPANVRVDSFDYTSLRALYARAALVVVPLADIDNQAGATISRRAMENLVVHPVAWPYDSSRTAGLALAGICDSAEAPYTQLRYALAYRSSDGVVSPGDADGFDARSPTCSNTLRSAHASGAPRAAPPRRSSPSNSSRNECARWSTPASEHRPRTSLSHAPRTVERRERARLGAGTRRRRGGRNGRIPRGPERRRVSQTS